MVTGGKPSLEISYRREMKHNYLIIKAAGIDPDNYEIRMLYGNPMEGALRFRTKQVDGDLFFYYEITSRQPLERILQNRCIKEREIREFMLQIARVLEEMEGYLLPEERVLLEPGCIYIEPDTFRAALCLVPGKPGSFPEDLSRLLQYLLKRVDHQDQRSVVLAYGLYQESLKENYGMDDLLLLLSAAGKKPIVRPEGPEANAAAGLADEAAQTEDGWPAEGRGRIEDNWQSEDRHYVGDSRRSEGGRQAEGKAVSRRSEGRHHIEDSRQSVSGRHADHTWREDGMQEGWRQPEAMEDSLIPFSAGREDMAGRREARESGMKGGFPLKRAIALGIPILVLPPAVWLFLGSAGLYQYRLWIAISEATLVLALALTVFFSLFAGDGKGEEPAGSGEIPAWQMVFSEEEPPEPAIKTPLDIQEPQTALLADSGEGKEGPSNRLTSLDNRTGDIRIPYFPFIIGKQEGMTDYVLPFDTVSRLHVRIDRQEEGYRITDLNSTNGTRVRGEALENNQTVDIYPGDEIYIADLGFVFL